MSERIQLVMGNIAAMPVEAIVTAANSALMGGGGVDGAVHRAAGPELRNALEAFEDCPEGSAVITPGFRLPAKWVIHAVGPIYVDGNHGEPDTLASAYHAALTLAAEKESKAVAFPCIGTGAFQYPRVEACGVAVDAVEKWLAENTAPETVYFCVFDPEDVPLYEERLGKNATPVESLAIA